MTELSLIWNASSFEHCPQEMCLRSQMCKYKTQFGIDRLSIQSIQAINIILEWIPEDLITDCYSKSSTDAEIKPIPIMAWHWIADKPLSKPTMTLFSYVSLGHNGLNYRKSITLTYIIRHDLGTWVSWWRHQMETFSALLAVYAGNSPVPGEFRAQRPVTRSFDVFFDLRRIKGLNEQSWGWWSEALSRPLWRHSNDY